MVVMVVAGRSQQMAQLSGRKLQQILHTQVKSFAQPPQHAASLSCTCNHRWVASVALSYIHAYITPHGFRRLTTVSSAPWPVHPLCRGDTAGTTWRLEPLNCNGLVPTACARWSGDMIESLHVHADGLRWTAHASLCAVWSQPFGSSTICYRRHR